MLDVCYNSISDLLISCKLDFKQQLIHNISYTNIRVLNNQYAIFLLNFVIYFGRDVSTVARLEDREREREIERERGRRSLNELCQK